VAAVEALLDLDLDRPQVVERHRLDLDQLRPVERHTR
jgi:hypothetical protein